MKSRILLFATIIVIAAGATSSPGQKNKKPMKFNAGIITTKLAASKHFYTTILGFTIQFENDWYFILQAPGGMDQISFLQPGHETQQPLFREAFTGKGVYLTVEIDDVDEMYERIKKLGVPIAIELRDEPWGDRHFAITDPNGIGVDIVSYRPPA